MPQASNKADEHMQDLAKSLAQKIIHAKVQAQQTQHWRKNPSRESELRIQYNND